MDISNFDTRQKSDEGVDFKLKSNGKIVKGDDGKPITFKFRGIHNSAIAELFRKSSNTPSDLITYGDIQAEQMDLAYLACVGWSSNFEVKGRKPEFSKESIEEIFGIPMFGAFVRDSVLQINRFTNAS